MAANDTRRRIGKVDRLNPDLKETVEQMLLTGSTYKEIVASLKEHGEEMSQMAICSYARKYLATVEMINIAQQNMAMLTDEMRKYPDLDTGDALIRLASHHIINALAGMDEDAIKSIDPEKLLRETNGIIRATAYKQRIDIQNKDKLDAGLDEVKSLVFESMAKERPELYKQVAEFLNSKKEGII